MPGAHRGPTPIVARLAYSDEMVQRLQAAGSRSDKKLVLQKVHAEVAAALTLELERLRTEGLILDFATSWLLAELVVHAPADRVADARTALEALPLLRDVGVSRRPRRR